MGSGATLLRAFRWASLVVGLGLGVYAHPAGAVTSPAVTVFTDQLAGPPLMGLGVQFDPYDTLKPGQISWPLIAQRLDFMRPGFLRVVEPASDYFGSYDSAGNPTYRWASPRVQELLSILAYAQSRGITVVLGDWVNPLIGGDARIPADFIAALHNTYGYSVIRYYNVMNEPNNGSSCGFTCWTQVVKAVSAEFAQVGFQSWLQLVGPDNANSWDDTQTAQALDRASGLDTDNPIGGDAWVTSALQTIPGLIGAYDSHRYATIWGVEHGVYGDQVRARREEISNLDSPAKPYFAGEVGLTARQLTPFTTRRLRARRSLLRSLMDPSATGASTFVDSQPHISSVSYGVWMGDMMVQAIASGLSGASAWDLDDAMHTGGGYGTQNLKQWGFWNSLGGQNGYPASDLAPRPWYYAWSVLSRAFPAGSEALTVPGTGVPGLRVAAAKIPAAGGYDLSIAIVNDSGKPHSVTLALPSVTGPLTLARYDYSAGEEPVDAGGLPVPAQTLQAQPAAGINLQLPASGLVVLTSHGFGTPAALNEGTTTLVDDLHDWHLTGDHSRRLRLDHSSPAKFNYATSRAVAAGKRQQLIVYRASQMTSFELKAYYPRNLRIGVYGSADGASWMPIAVAGTEPAPAVGGQEMLAELLPSQALPAGTNRLMITLGGGTELAQVRIAAGRSGTACLASALATRGNSIGGLGLGASRRGILGLLGAPGVRGRRVWRYCVVGGGYVGVVFARRGGAELIASTAAGYRPGGVGPGTSAARLQRRYGRSGLTAAGRGVLVSSTGNVFAIRAGRVDGVAIAAPSLLAHGRSLQSAVMLAL